MALESPLSHIALDHTWHIEIVKDQVQQRRHHHVVLVVVGAEVDQPAATGVLVDDAADELPASEDGVAGQPHETALCQSGAWRSELPWDAVAEGQLGSWSSGPVERQASSHHRCHRPELGHAELPNLRSPGPHVRGDVDAGPLQVPERQAGEVEEAGKVGEHAAALGGLGAREVVLVRVALR